jgi:hypothetical protein
MFVPSRSRHTFPRSLSSGLSVRSCRYGPESYWRTRTIGKAREQGYSHARISCSGCGRVTDIPWKLLLRPP